MAVDYEQVLLNTVVNRGEAVSSAIAYLGFQVKNLCDTLVSRNQLEDVLSKTIQVLLEVKEDGWTSDTDQFLESLGVVKN